jgi:undecaprenyl-phosphate galactose phosphotransferase
MKQEDPLNKPSDNRFDGDAQIRRAKHAAGELAIGASPSAPTRQPAVVQGYQRYSGKRVFDIAGALILGLFSLPVILVIAIAIRLTGSPVFYSHTRGGLGRRHFRCYKFRTMVPNAQEVLQDLLHSDTRSLQEWRENHKLRNDPRITRLGNFLRTSSLDELPQLWNVLKGDMSLVGPRPVVPDELERYGNRAQSYIAVRPGMSGLWQVSGRSNLTYSRRVSLDMLYVRRQCVALDLWVLWRTIFVVFDRGGSY